VALVQQQLPYKSSQPAVTPHYQRGKILFKFGTTRRPLA